MTPATSSEPPDSRSTAPIQNGTAPTSRQQQQQQQFKIPPIYGCRSQASSTSSVGQHANSIPPPPLPLPKAASYAAVNVNETNTQAGSVFLGENVVVDEHNKTRRRRGRRRSRSRSRENLCSLQERRKHRFSFATAVPLICLLVIGLHVQIECKSVESSALLVSDPTLDGNSLLNNLIPQQQQQQNQSTTESTDNSRANRLVYLSVNHPPNSTTAATTSTTTTTATSEPPLTSKTIVEETTVITEATTETEEIEDGSSAGRDDDDAESCKGISANGSAKAKNLTDHERLVNLQSCFQRKINNQLMSTRRSGMEMFEKLSLSGGCSSSLMALMMGLGQLKSFAFKFIDASAKIPSGMMNGLLSDYGDFDQCMSIRSNKNIPLEQEAEEGTFSGKYCLMSLKLNYHVKLPENATVPEGIIEDGIFWDELVRHYWTSKLSKGFQIGMCFPSRCTNDDLNQLYQHVANEYNVIGEIISCQDGLDLKRQNQPDLLQCAILCCLYALLGLTLVGTIVDRCCFECLDRIVFLSNIARLLICFSISKNWTKFMRGYDQNDDSRLWKPRASKQVSNDNKTSPSRCEEATITHNRISTTSSSSDDVDFIDTDPDSSSANTTDNSVTAMPFNNKLAQPLTVQIDTCVSVTHPVPSSKRAHLQEADPLAHLSGLKLFIIIWITVGYSFLYPSANNYQYYRSIIKMNFTRDSVWFATTNFTLGIDMLLYITGLLFVYKLLGRRSEHQQQQQPPPSRASNRSCQDAGSLSLISRKAIRFWPTYLTVIGFAIVVPLISDGPMWPEMVSKRIGESCRHNWWSNLLFINNYLGQSDICLPSSWFISILMQLFIIGSIVVVLVRRISLGAGLAVLSTLLMASVAFSFGFAYFLKLRAPVITMDESFVMDLDENIFRLYTNIFNNLGPFLVGMAGGLLLVRTQKSKQQHRPAPTTTAPTTKPHQLNACLSWMGEIAVASIVAAIAILVLSSVFHEHYTQLASSIYWSLHRIGWAIVTGYIIHQCATGKWKLLNDLLSLSAFAPLSRLIFIAYLVYPIFIHIHTGLVRDGLHVSIYNMLNIYITRLVMTFVTALIIHLLVELPFSTIEELYLRKWTSIKSCSRKEASNNNKDRLHPLLTVAHPDKCQSMAQPDLTRIMQANNSSDKLIPLTSTGLHDSESN